MDLVLEGGPLETKLHYIGFETSFRSYSIVLLTLSTSLYKIESRGVTSFLVKHTTKKKKF